MRAGHFPGLLVGAVAIALVCPTAAWGTSLTVPDDVPTIQAALDAGVDTVTVRAGAYAESPIVRRPVALVCSPSAENHQARVEGLLIAPVSAINGPGYRFRGIESTGTVTMDNSEVAATIEFATCKFLGGMSDVSPFVDTWTVAFHDCTLVGMSEVFVRSTVTLDSCTVTGSLHLGGGLIVVDIHGSTFVGSGGGYGLLVDYADTATLDGNTMTDYGIGAAIDADTKIAFTNNRLTRCTYKGAYLQHQDLEVRGNVLRECGMGFELSSGAKVVASGNVILWCTGPGMRIRFGDGSEVGGNVVARCAGAGIEFHGYAPEGCTVRQNTLVGNGGAGLVWDAAPGGEVVGNLICSNQAYGIDWLRPNDGRVACNDLIGNVPSDVRGRDPSPFDIAVAPQFCDAGNENFTLLNTSPLLSWLDCGQIGALGAGCAVTATTVTRFDAARTTDGIRIAWELGYGATASQVWLERSDAGENGPWSRAVTQRSNDGATTIEVDRGAEAHRGYWYRLVALEGTTQEVIGAPITVGPVANLPFALTPLKPNPSSGPVRIGFTLPHPAQIQIDVIDLQGRLVASLARGAWPAGRHEVQWSASAGAGMYLVRYRYPGSEERRRIIRVP